MIPVVQYKMEPCFLGNRLKRDALRIPEFFFPNILQSTLKVQKNQNVRFKVSIMMVCIIQLYSVDSLI